MLIWNFYPCILHQETGRNYLGCSEDFFEELESDHLINGSIPTIRHPLYSKIKQHHLELYRVLHDKTKIHHVTKFYAVSGKTETHFLYL